MNAFGKFFNMRLASSRSRKLIRQMFNFLKDQFLHEAVIFNVHMEWTKDNHGMHLAHTKKLVASASRWVRGSSASNLYKKYIRMKSKAGCP